MIRLKRRTFSGCVCEQEVFCAATVRNYKSAEPRPRFANKEERDQHKLNISRRRHARLVNENFNPGSLYSTLTFDMDNEVHDYIDAKKLRDLFVRRLKRKYPDAVIFIYMGKGKHTNRIHLHMLSHGVPQDYIEKQWIYGSINRIEHLRSHNFYDGVDHGCDYTALANYLFEHWEPEQGRHRWKQTRNARQPEREEATLCIRKYSEEHPPRAPKGYKLVETRSTKYGYLYFKYIVEPHKE